MATFWATGGKIGLLFITTSGHTVRTKMENGRENFTILELVSDLSFARASCRFEKPKLKCIQCDQILV